MDGAEGRTGLTFYEVSKAFGRLEAVQDFSLRVRRGEVLALFGPNGAGKTTLLRAAAGLAAPSAGRILVDGVDLREAPSKAKQHIGFAGDRPLFYPDLTARENLEFSARLYGLSRTQARQAAEDALSAHGLSHRAADPAGTLSHGLAQRLSLARAVIHAPSVLLLDEPFEGLDARAVVRLLELLQDEAERMSRAVLLSTHRVDLAWPACDRAALMDGGRLVRVVGKSEYEPQALAREVAELGGDAHGKPRGP